MRTNMTNIIIEREELENIQKENDLLTQQTVKLQEEIIHMQKTIKQLQLNKLNTDQTKSQIIVSNSNNNEILSDDENIDMEK